MARRKREAVVVDHVDAILSAWDAATTDERNEALRCIRRVERLQDMRNSDVAIRTPAINPICTGDITALSTGVVTPVGPRKRGRPRKVAPPDPPSPA